MKADAQAPVLALIGLRCAGKTTVGRALAARTGARFVDLDEVVALKAGARSPGEALHSLGLERFRDLEEQALGQVLDSAEGPTVLATGGGTVERVACRERLAGGATIAWLKAPLAVLRRRMLEDAETSRPRITGEGEEEFISLERRRGPWFEALANEVLEVGERGPDELALELERLWDR